VSAVCTLKMSHLLGQFGTWTVMLHYIWFEGRVHPDSVKWSIDICHYDIKLGLYTYKYKFLEPLVHSFAIMNGNTIIVYAYDETIYNCWVLCTRYCKVYNTSVNVLCMKHTRARLKHVSYTKCPLSYLHSGKYNL